MAEAHVNKAVGVTPLAECLQMFASAGGDTNAVPRARSGTGKDFNLGNGKADSCFAGEVGDSEDIVHVLDLKGGRRRRVGWVLMFVSILKTSHEN